MKLVYPKLLGYASILFIIALAQSVLLLRLVTAPGSRFGFGFGFLSVFVGSQVLLALMGMVFAFRRRHV